MGVKLRLRSATFPWCIWHKSAAGWFWNLGQRANVRRQIHRFRACWINRSIDHSPKRKSTGCSSIKPPEIKRVACERKDDANDVIAVDEHDQRNIPNNNSKPIGLIDRIFPSVIERHNNHSH
ncbi:hypothetical protein Pst134EB_028531 [Puccinia striiformis f. sp. tritici]|nr:hypothetical protein Pst134EB_028531 [Puccinia striiformis f. sp. tritici]